MQTFAAFWFAVYPKPLIQTDKVLVMIFATLVTGGITDDRLKRESS